MVVDESIRISPTEKGLDLHDLFLNLLDERRKPPTARP
jgi:hypothetical protein